MQQRKNNISSQDANKFIDNLNLNIQEFTNAKFQIFIPKKEEAHPYGYLYYKNLQDANKIIKWLSEHGIHAISSFVETHKHYLVKIPRVTVFPHDFFHGKNLDNQQLELIRTIKTENDGLQLFKNDHIKKLISLVMATFSAINTGLKSTTKFSGNDNPELHVDSIISNYSSSHRETLNYFNPTMLEYYKNISANFLVFETSLFSDQSIFSSIMLHSGSLIVALEAVFEKMISYGVYIEQYINIINRNNEIVLFLIRDHENIKKNSELLAIFKKLKEVEPGINPKLSFLASHCFNIQMYFFYKLGILQGNIVGNNVVNEVKEEAVLFENNIMECEQHIKNMNSLIDELSIQVKKIFNQDQGENITALINGFKSPVFSRPPHVEGALQLQDNDSKLEKSQDLRL